MKKIKYILIFILTLLCIAIAVSFVLLNSKVNSDAKIVLVVYRGMKVVDALETLNRQNVLLPSIFYKTIIRFYVKYSKAKLLAGTHTFDSNISNLELIKQLLNNEALNHIKVTFPEGITIQQVASILKTKIDVDSVEFVKMANNPQLCETLQIQANSLEGYFKPDTYYFSGNETIIEIIDILVGNYPFVNAYLTAEELEQFQMKGFFLETKSPSRGTAKVRHPFSDNEILTLASIIEAETPVIAERKHISGVYYNRLAKKMPLGADPTIQYILGKRKERLLYSDLEIDNPYNTYKNIGLPPGPINSPSKSSIEAAIRPDFHNYYYFVAKGDGSNKHNFASTYKEHLRNVAIYKVNMKQHL